MLETFAVALVYTLAVYLGLGFIFAVVFALRGVQSLDTVAVGTRLGFRLLILPGVAALWPLFLNRWLRGVVEPPTEKNPHR